MGLFTCRSCGASVSTAANACPSCGHVYRQSRRDYDYETQNRDMTALKFLLLGVFVVGCVLATIGQFAH